MQYYIDDNETINGARQVDPNDKHAKPQNTRVYEKYFVKREINA